MKRHIGIFLAGVAVIAPVAVTAYVVWWVAVQLDKAGRAVLGDVGQRLFIGAGILVIVVSIYLLGLLTHLWLFRRLLGWLERIIDRLPGVKTLYQSVRELMALFGKGSERMGKVVEYHPPGMSGTLLGLLTN